MPTLKATLFLLLVLLPLRDARLFKETDGSPDGSPDGDKLSLDMHEKQEDEAKTEDLDSETKDTESKEDGLVRRMLKSSSHKRQDDMPGVWGRSIESKDGNEIRAQLVKLDESEENEERRDEGAEPRPPGLWGREFEKKLHAPAGEWERGIENRRPPGLWGREIENGPPGLWGREFENKVPKPARVWEREIENGPPGLWGREIENGPPGLWGREIEKGPPGLWGREFENKVPKPAGVWEREIENGPPGLWGREIENGPPGLWGREIENVYQDRQDSGDEKKMNDDDK